MPLPKMSWDTDEYLRELSRYKKLRGFYSMGEAEFSLYPIRAKKRAMKIAERKELEATICLTKRKSKS